MSRLYKLLLPDIGKTRLIKYALLSILSGLWGFLFMSLVTQVISIIIANEYTIFSKEYVLVFSAVILFFIWTRKILSTAVIGLSQKIFWTIRKQILSLILQANFEQLNDRRTKIHSAMVNDVNILTNASMSIIDFLSAVILSLSCLIYLAYISLLLFFITLVVAALGIIIYQYGARKNIANFVKSRSLEDSFIEHFNAVLNGFKEIYLEPKKGAMIYSDKITPLSNEAYINNKTAFVGFLNLQITGQVLFYVLISSILLFFSLTLNIKSTDTVRYVFTLLYLLGSIETIMVLLPHIMRAKVSSDRLMDLKNELEQAHFCNPVALHSITKDEFEQLQIEGLEFHYTDKDKSFSIGPIDFEILKGETIFIYGANGSGKTTFIKALLGIGKPTHGTIHANGVLVAAENYPIYRTLFSVVFNDFYLFNELLGVEQVNIEKWNYYIELFELQDKVKLEGRTFSTTDLSTGQRKRLALIAALQEEKPILVLDEWAADQDPYFRGKFYTHILPVLKKDGLTIIAITHDDKYYRCADKLFRMEEGKLKEETAHLHQSHLNA